MRKKVAILNLNNSNIKSIYSAIKMIGFEPVLIEKKNQLNLYNYMVLPGVGTFKSAINFLKKKDLIKEIKEFNSNKKKILAICLGMQILVTTGNEFGKASGLNIIEGKVIPFGKNKINLGWCKINFKKQNKIKNFFGYFVHSYQVITKQKNIIQSTSEFENSNFISSYRQDNILGCQFHPEKSGKEGLALMKNFFLEN